MAVDLTTAMNPAYHSAYWNTLRFLVLYGGAGSGKSYFAAQKIILRMMSERGHTFLCVRKVAATLRNSVFALLNGVISKWGVGGLFSVNKTDMTILYRPNGNTCILAGLDDVEKLKSITGQDGEGITGLWVEEATELTPEDLIQLNLRLRGQHHNYMQIILTFNPISIYHWLKARFFDVLDPAACVLKTTFEDNNFIDEPYKEELRKLERIDPALYKIYAKGEWGILKGVIYSWLTRSWPEGAQADDTIYCLDFGFNNPMSLNKVRSKDHEFWVEELIYERGLTTGKLADRMEEMGITGNDMLYCDAAEPDRIQELCDRGFFALPARKGQGSVNAGIIFLKHQKIWIMPGSNNIIAEVGSYKWREDKDGTIMDEPAKFNDHAMDAIRYGIFTHFGQDNSYKVSVL